LSSVSVRLEIFLFGKPGWEIEMEGKKLDVKFADELRDLAKYLYERLNKIAEIHEKLVKNGWKAEGSLYDITYWKDVTLKQAKQELKQLGIPEEYISFMEEIKPEEETEEEGEGEELVAEELEVVEGEKEPRRYMYIM